MTVTLLIHDSLDCCDGGAITVSKADTADSLKDDNDAFTSLIDEVKSEFIGTYVPTADRHQGAVVYKKMVTDEDGTLLWLHRDMDILSFTASNATISLSMTDIKNDEFLQKLLQTKTKSITDGNANGDNTWVIVYDKPNPGPHIASTFGSTSEANCPVNQTIKHQQKTPFGLKIPLEYLSIKCT